MRGAEPSDAAILKLTRYVRGTAAGAFYACRRNRPART